MIYASGDDDDFCLNIDSEETTESNEISSKNTNQKLNGSYLEKRSIAETKRFKKVNNTSSRVINSVTSHSQSNMRSTEDLSNAQKSSTYNCQATMRCIETKSITTHSNVDQSENQASKANLQQSQPSRQPCKHTYNPLDDPDQFHANPRHLSKDSLQQPRQPVTFSDLIFTRTSFHTMPLHPRLIEILNSDRNQGGLELKTTTRIQNVTFPLLQQNNNILMKSQTGSGKTLAYLLPLINDLMKQEKQIQRGDGTRALIIAPTRELCSQITDILVKLTKSCVWIVTGSISGGEKKKSEKARLRKGVTVLVCTPGRLLDHLKTTEAFHLVNLRWLVLDEADRLLDMGFEQTILEIVSRLMGHSLPGLKVPIESIAVGNKYSVGNSTKLCSDASNLRHVMVSATLTRTVQQLALPLMNSQPFIMVDADTERVDTITTVEDILKTSLHVMKFTSNNGVISFENDDDSQHNHIKNGKRTADAKGNKLDDNERIDTPQQLAQYYMNVTGKWRLAALMSFLRTKVTVEKLKVMVFFSTCDAVDYHALLLRESTWPTHMDNPDSLPFEPTDMGFDNIYSSSDSGNISGNSSKLSNANSLNKQGEIQRMISKHTKLSSIQGKKISTLKSLNAKFNGGFLGAKVNIFRLHGNMAHHTRQEVYHNFCSIESECVLLCTDVAARGLDLPKIDWILQYDPPCDITDYAHRAGRTARKGLGGSALLFLLPSEASFIPLLYSHNLRPEALSLQSLFFDVSKHIPGALKFKNVDELAAVILQRRLELTVEGNKLMVSAGQQAFRSFVRAYASHSSDTKGIFQVQKLHLGHVAKSFALRASPNAMRNRQDIIGEIANGKYEINIDNLDKAQKQALRDEKYSLSNNSSRKKQSRNDDINSCAPNKRFKDNKALSFKGQEEGNSGGIDESRIDVNIQRQSLSSVNATNSPIGVDSVPAHRLQKLKKVGKSFKKISSLSVRKQMIRQANSEFSNS